MATDYDKGKLTDREKQAGKNQNALGKYNEQTEVARGKFDKSAQNAISKWNENVKLEEAKRNANNTKSIAEYNARSTSNQYNQQIGNYDFANRQNANLRDTQFKQASRKSEAERFEAQRQLQNAALGLFGSMNQAMNSSTVGNTMKMLADRNDADNSTYWNTLQDNRQQIQNAYDESYNQNQVAKRDAAINAIKALRDTQGSLASELNNIQTDLWSNIGNIRTDLFGNLANITGDTAVARRNARGELAANLNNINPNLFFDPTGGQKAKLEADLKKLQSAKKPDKKKIKELQEEIKALPKSPIGDVSVPTEYNIPKGKSNVFQKRYNIYEKPGSDSNIYNALQVPIQNQLSATKEHNSTLLNYIMPANAEQNVRNRRNTLSGNDYYSRLINGFNR